MTGWPRVPASSVARGRRNKHVTYSDKNGFEQRRPGDAVEGVRGGWPPPPPPPDGGVGRPPGDAVGEFQGEGPPFPRPPGGGVGGVRGGVRGEGPGRRASSSPAAGWRGGGVLGEGPTPPRPLGCGVGGVRGDGPRLSRHIRPRHNHLSPERRTNYSLSGKVADFIDLEALFSLSSALCISITASLRTNLSSANGAGGEAWANACKLLNGLGRVVVWRFHKNASVGRVRKCASIDSGLSEPARVLPSPFI